MGGPEKLAERRAQGVLNARERIDCLVDPGSFIESGRHARGIRPEVEHKTPADGKTRHYFLLPISHLLERRENQ